MAYNNANLVLTGSTQQDSGPFYWVYTTADSVNDVDDSGYFNGAYGRIRYGDVIRIVASDAIAMFRVTGAYHPATVSLNLLEVL